MYNSQDLESRKQDALRAELFDFAPVFALLNTKGAEYSGTVDRLKNFRRTGDRLNLSMHKVWAVFFTKHFDALMQYIEDQDAEVVRVRSEPIIGRVHDMIAYLIIFTWMLAETDDAASVQKHVSE